MQDVCSEAYRYYIYVPNTQSYTGWNEHTWIYEPHNAASDCGGMFARDAMKQLQVAYSNCVLYDYATATMLCTQCSA